MRQHEGRGECQDYCVSAATDEGLTDRGASGPRRTSELAQAKQASLPADNPVSVRWSDEDQTFVGCIVGLVGECCHPRTSSLNLGTSPEILSAISLKRAKFYPCSRRRLLQGATPLHFECLPVPAGPQNFASCRRCFGQFHEALARLAELGTAEAPAGVVVDHADALHEGIEGGGSDKVEPIAAQSLAHGFGFRRLGGQVGH